MLCQQWNDGLDSFVVPPRSDIIANTRNEDEAVSNRNKIQNSKASKNGIIKERLLTVKAAMDELNQVMAVPVRIKKETIWIRTDIPPNAIKLIKAIGMQIPPKILPQNHRM